MDAYAHRMAIGRRFGARVAAGDAVFLSGARAISALPCTISNGQRRHLGGMNRFMLLQVMKDEAWNDPRFFTSAQIRQEGWTIAPGAKKIGLQFMIATGDDGLPLEEPQVKQFHVFNASEIAGVPELAAAPVPPITYLEGAVAQAGFQVDAHGLRPAVTDWLSSLQDIHSNTGPAGATLRVQLAAALLEVQARLPGEGVHSEALVSEWARGIDGDPLSFFQAVKDAEVLAATVMSQVDLVGKELKMASDLALAIESSKKVQKTALGESMERSKAVASERVEAMFSERAAVLAVPFRDKERAKALGAVWYGPQSLWFVPNGIDCKRFREWDLSANSLGPTATEEVVINDFKAAMTQLGLDTSKPIVADGAWHNVSVNTKPEKNGAGSYILSLNGTRSGDATGMINNKHTGESLPWKYDGALLTPEQRARVRAEALVREAAAAQELVKTQNAAAVNAAEIWAAAVDASSHGYVVKKGIASDQLRQVPGAVLLKFPEFTGADGVSIIRDRDNYLIVPMLDSSGKLRALQAISEDGSVKSFMRGGQKKGTMLVLGASSFDAAAGMDLSAIAYVEGIATGASFRAAAGIPVVVCFDAGNLEAVAAQTASKLPEDVVPILAVDNDQFHVERALGFLAIHLGTNPHAPGGVIVKVGNETNRRAVELGDVVPDGQWHQAPGGKYFMSVTREHGSGLVRSVAVEIVTDDGNRKLRSTFVNRGVEAGRKAKQSFANGEGVSRAVMLMPEFKSLLGRPSDWNDLAKLEGTEAFRPFLQAAGRQSPTAKMAEEKQTKTTEIAR